MSNKINQVSSSKNYGDAALKDLVEQPYRYGFKTQIETEDFPKGLNEDIVALISEKRNEPSFMLEFRLRAYKSWKIMEAPEWACITHAPIDYQNILYYSVPKTKNKLSDLGQVDQEILNTFEKLGIPLNEQKRLANVAVDAIFDSVSIGTTFREELSKVGVIFCPISEALKQYPELVKKYLSTVVPIADNYFAALNSAVFTEGSFCYIPVNLSLIHI
jgi:Fe-S cluster assembly protein SufB